MTLPSLAVVPAVAALIVACGGSHRASPSPSTPSTSGSGTSVPAGPDTVAQGTVRVTGSDPGTQVVLQGNGPELGLIGSLRSELAALHGAEVRVSGARVTSGLPIRAGGIDVSRYAVIGIGGRWPEVGSLAERSGGLWLVGADTLQLTGAPADLTGRPGAKVWIVGTRRDGMLTVESYGVIRDAGRR